MIPEGEQGCDVSIRDQPHVAAFATISTIRPTERLRSLTAERRTAGATVAAAYIQLRFIDEPAHRTS